MKLYLLGFLAAIFFVPSSTLAQNNAFPNCNRGELRSLKDAGFTIAEIQVHCSEAKQSKTPRKNKKHRKNAGNFIVTPRAGIPGYNRETYNNVSLRQCQSLCLQRGWCKSVDYERSARRCFVQPVNKHEQGLRKNYPGHPYDHYTLSGR